MRIKIFPHLLSFVLIAAIFGCSHNAKSVTDVSTPSILQPTPITNNIPANADKFKFKFKTAGGTELFSIKQQADGAKLVDGKNQELARIKTDKSGQTKIRNYMDKILGYIIYEKSSWRLSNPEQNQESYILKLQSDGDYKLEDSAKKQIYQIKAQAQGFEIQTPDKKLVYLVRVKENKISLRNADNNTIFSTKSELSPIAFTCFGFDVLTREQQAGLAYVVNLTGGK